MPFFRHVRRNARMLPMAAASDRRRATLGRSIGRGSARKNARSSQRGNGPPECQALKPVDRTDRPLSSCPTDQRWTEAGLLPPLPPAGIRTVFLGRSGPIQGVRRWLRLIRLFRLFRLSARIRHAACPGSAIACRIGGCPRRIRSTLGCGVSTVTSLAEPDGLESGPHT